MLDLIIHVFWFCKFLLKLCGGNVHVLLYLPVWFDIINLVLYDIVV